MTITIHGTNDGPMAVTDAGSVTEDTNTVAQPNPVSGNVLGNDTDVDVGDTHSVTVLAGFRASVAAVTGVQTCALHIHSDGSYTYTLNNALGSVQALAA